MPHTAAIPTSMTCSTDGCDASLGMFDTYGAAVAAARGSGWAVMHHRFRCPEHRKQNQPRRRSDPRTGMDAFREVVMAECIARLLAGGVIVRRPDVVELACRVTGTTPRQVAEAATAHELRVDRRRVAPEPPKQQQDHSARVERARAVEAASAVVSEQVVDRAPAGSTKVREHRVVDGEMQLRCNGGPGVMASHWAPVSAFAPRSDRDRDGRAEWYGRRSSCHDCTQIRQRERYLSVKAKKQLGAVGLEFVVTDVDPELRCVECGDVIQSGAVAVGDADIRHAGCGSAA